MVDFTAMSRRLLRLIPAAAALMQIKGGTQIALTLAAEAQRGVLSDVHQYQHFPSGGGRGRGTAAHKRMAKKTKAVKRARRLKHA